jgi:ankyrin repeat protein
VEFGMNVDERLYNGYTPLMIAAESGDLELAKFLAGSGASTELKTLENGETPLIIAVKRNHKDVANYLLKETRVDVRATDSSGFNALYWALVRGTTDMKLFKRLAVHRGKPIKWRDVETGKTPLMFCQRDWHARALLEVGMKINDKDKDGRSALYHAINDARFFLIKYLLEKGIDHDQTNFIEATSQNVYVFNEPQNGIKYKIIPESK